MKEKFIYRVVIDICINYPGHSRGKIDGINIFKKSYLRQKMGMIGVKITRVADEVMECDKTEYSIHSLSKVVDGENRNDWILVKIYRIGK